VRLAVVPSPTRKKDARHTGDGRLAVVLYRRMMVRVAERIARASKAQALVTGEALAQVASQTLENSPPSAPPPPSRSCAPASANDKLDTIAIAERIGTYETSILPFDDCCSLFVPDHPVTKAKLDDVVCRRSESRRGGDRRRMRGGRRKRRLFRLNDRCVRGRRENCFFGGRSHTPCSALRACARHVLARCYAGIAR